VRVLHELDHVELVFRVFGVEQLALGEDRHTAHRGGLEGEDRLVDDTVGAPVGVDHLQQKKTSLLRIRVFDKLAFDPHYSAVHRKFGKGGGRVLLNPSGQAFGARGVQAAPPRARAHPWRLVSPMRRFKPRRASTSAPRAVPCMT
jgi:hypothetical protein